MASPLSVFVSHSSQDEDLALCLVHLLERSLQLQGKEIRCSSLSGHRLATGVDIDAVLRDELLGAKFFVALLTPSSLKSSFVLFELGARWGAGLSLFPILAGNASIEHLPEPLKRLHCLTASDRGQVHQLIEDLALGLDLTARSPTTYSRDLDELVVLSKRVPPPPPGPAKARTVRALPLQAGSLDQGQREKVIGLIANCAGRYSRVSVVPTIPERFLSAARAREWLKEDDHVLGLARNSHQGEDGLGILSTGIVWRNSYLEKPGRLAWAELAGLRIRADRKAGCVRLGPGTQIDCSRSDIPVSDLARLLREILRVL